jgi:hypothetical protein
MNASATRAKVSTTIARENFEYLEGLVASGQARNLAQALDLTLHRSRKLENRRRLEQATAAYYDALSPDAQAEDEAWVEAASRAGAEIDFDHE